MAWDAMWNRFQKPGMVDKKNQIYSLENIYPNKQIKQILGLLSGKMFSRYKINHGNFKEQY